MTKNEIRMIASILATREAAIEELNVSLTEKLGARFAHRATAFDFAWELDHISHDFNRAEFLASALPLFSNAPKWKIEDNEDEIARKIAEHEQAIFNDPDPRYGP